MDATTRALVTVVLLSSHPAAQQCVISTVAGGTPAPTFAGTSFGIATDAAAPRCGSRYREIKFGAEI